MLAQHLGDRRPLNATAPAIGVAVVVALFGRLLDPDLALATRDFVFFHLPLRVDFARLAFAGLPSWNPWLNGGQPLLSNPNYAAFYPPSWLVLVVPPAYALSLVAVFHSALAFAGAWMLARKLGCEPPAAALAALGYAAGGGFVSLLHAFNLFCGMAWFPWVLLGGLAVVDRGGEDGAGSWWGAAAATAGALAATALCGEPVAAIVNGLALVALAASAARRPRRALRLAAPVAIAVLVAAVQLVPTWERLGDSPRAGPLAPDRAGVWSAPPARLAELVLPRLYGDPARSGEQLYFGWSLNDKHFPYVVSVYPGVLVSVLALAALIRWPVRRRGAWTVAVSLGLFFGLGRHNPLFGFVHGHLPLLGMVRYPEKFLLLLVATLPFAAALGWQQLVDDQRRGESRTGDFPIALALAVGVLAAAVAIWLGVAPAAAGFVRAGAGHPLSPAAVAAGVDFLAAESWIAVATAAAAAAVIALLRWRRLPPAAVGVLAVALLGADLWRCSHGLVTVVPADEYRLPPPTAAVITAQERVFSDELIHGGDELAVVRNDEPELDHLRPRLQRLDPYAGNLWGVAYAFNRDYDLMLTRWGRLAHDLLVAEWKDPARVVHLLGAWNVGTVVVRKPTEAILAELARGEEEIDSALFYSNPEVLPRFRIVPEVAFHATGPAARAAARAARYDVSRRDHWIAPDRPPEEAAARPAAELLALDDVGGRVEARYRAPGGGFLVAATTFDRGWTAAVDGRPVATYPTAVGQIGVELPAGEHRLELRYETPRLAAGAALTLAGLLVLAAMLVVGSRAREAT